MNAITHIPTSELQPGDVLLHGASTLSVDRVEPADFYDEPECWLYVTCCSGNFDQYEEPLRVAAGDVWQVLRS